MINWELVLITCGIENIMIIIREVLIWVGGRGHIESDSIIIFRVTYSWNIIRYSSFNEVDLLFNTVIFVLIIINVSKEEIINFFSSSFTSYSTSIDNILEGKISLIVFGKSCII